MTAAGRQDAAGGASALALFTAINDPNALSFQATGTVSGWVFSNDFTICIDENTASEEKMLCTSIAGSNPSVFTVLTRGYDGTVPTTHGVGAPITHVFPATMAMDFERHVYNTSEDDHTQYLNGLRHDTPANHEFGTPGSGFAFGAGTTVPADVGTAANAGSGASPARDDHVHELGDASIDAWTLVATGLIGLDADIAPLGVAAAGSVGKFADAGHVHPYPDAMTYAQITALSGAALWVGREVYQTDTGAGRPAAGKYTYNGVAWRLPWNLPWGTLIRTVMTSDATAYVGYTNVSGLATTFTPPCVNRMYEIQMECAFHVTGAANPGALAKITDSVGATILEQRDFPIDQNSPLSGQLLFQWTQTFTAVAHTLTPAVAHAGDGTVTLDPGAGNGSAMLWVKDVGPNGDPA